MEKAYRLLPWLEIDQAIDWLQSLTGTLLSERVLLRLGRAREVDVYVQILPPGIPGKTSDTKEKVTLSGMQQVLNPDMALEQSVQTCAVLKHGDAHWIGLLPARNQSALFKSADIEALAAKMNRTGGQPSDSVADRSLTERRINAIREWLKDNGRDDTNPSQPQGKRGDKADAMDALVSNNPELFTRATFDAAWKELRKQNEALR